MPSTTNYQINELIERYGLVNQGSNCYLNCIVHVLFSLNELRLAIDKYNGEINVANCFKKYYR